MFKAENKVFLSRFAPKYALDGGACSLSALQAGAQ